MAESRMRVLAIDDNLDNLISLEALVRTFLPACEMVVTQAAHEGVSLATSFQPDVILLDVQMPEMDGFEVCRMLKANPAAHHIPVIFLTAHVTDSASKIRGLEMGADAFLMKPIEPGELVAQIRAMVRMKRAEDVLRGEKLSLERAVAERTAALEENITERKRTEEALEAALQRLRFHVENSPLAVVEFDTEFRITRWSGEAERVFGWTASEVLGRRIGDLRWVHEDDVEIVAELVSDMTAGRKTRNVLTNGNYRKHGTVLTCEWYNSALVGADGKLVSVLSLILDVTEREKAVEELNRHTEELRLRSHELDSAVKELERASRAKDEFLASTSHELRTPLNGILGMSELMLSGIQGPLSERQIRSVKLIEEGGRHLLDLINDVLDVAKIEAGRLALKVEPCGVAEICDASAAMVRQLALRRRIELVLDVDPAAGQVTADGRRLKQILVNLLSNGVKFTPEGGRVELKVATDEARHEIRLTVADTGIGIATEDLPRLFQPFTQLDARLAREHGGTGLGLTLVQRMTELHGGRVDVESAKGEGSRFTVTLPWTPEGSRRHLASGSDPIPRPFTLAPVVAHPAAGVSVVLLVEDDPVAVEILSSFLPGAGYRLEVARTGPEGLEMAKRTEPDIILMDIQLPEMDGMEVIRRLRLEKRFATTPVIALTALAMTGDRERVVAAGADDYLSKPVPLRTLEAKIRALLGRRRCADGLSRRS